MMLVFVQKIENLQHSKLLKQKRRRNGFTFEAIPIVLFQSHTVQRVAFE